MLRAITANRLIEGDAVFLARKGWTGRFGEALVAENDEELAKLTSRAAEDEAAGRVVEVYPIEVERAESGLRPVKLRERLRTLGPTVRPDLGYQAQAHHEVRG